MGDLALLRFAELAGMNEAVPMRMVYTTAVLLRRFAELAGWEVLFRPGDRYTWIGEEASYDMFGWRDSEGLEWFEDEFTGWTGAGVIIEELRRRGIHLDIEVGGADFDYAAYIGSIEHFNDLIVDAVLEAGIAALEVPA